MVSVSGNSSSLSAERVRRGQASMSHRESKVTSNVRVTCRWRRPHLRWLPPSWPSSGRWLSPDSAETPAGKAHNRRT